MRVLPEARPCFRLSSAGCVTTVNTRRKGESPLFRIQKLSNYFFAYCHTAWLNNSIISITNHFFQSNRKWIAVRDWIGLFGIKDQHALCTCMRCAGACVVRTTWKPAIVCCDLRRGKPNDKEQNKKMTLWKKTRIRPGGGGGTLTRFSTGSCHRGFKNIPVPYTNFSKLYTRLYTNFSKIYTRLYTKFPKMHTRSYTNCVNCENWYRSLYQNREIRYPSRWHVPVPKICIVPLPGGIRYTQKTTVALKTYQINLEAKFFWKSPRED